MVKDAILLIVSRIRGSRVYKRFYIISLILILCLEVGCVQTNDEVKLQSEHTQSEEKPDKLVVYLTGDEMVTIKEDGSHTVDYYFSTYSIGPCYPVFLQYGSKGHILYDALDRFEKETGIELELHHFKLKGDLEKQLKIDWENNTSPDVVLLDYMTYGEWDSDDNFYRLIANEWFYDVMPFMEQDGIYESTEYYNQVLRAGVWKDAQLLLPILFNISTLSVSEQEMIDREIYLDQELNFDEMLERLTDACMIRDIEGVDFLGSNIDLSLIVAALWQASGEPVINYETGQVTLDRETFEYIAEFYQQYLKMEYSENWEERIELVDNEMKQENWLWGGRAFGLTSKSTYRDFGLTDNSDVHEWFNQGFIYMEGGNGLQQHFHSFIGQAALLDSLCAEDQQQLRLIAIPQANEASYTALVNLCGGVVKESDTPYYSYTLLKYLMDQSYFPYCAVSVNRGATEGMLDELYKTQYLLDPFDGIMEEREKNEAKSIEIDPLREEVGEDIRYILEHIGSSVLPTFYAYIPIMKHSEAYALGYENMEEAYSGACDELWNVYYETMERGS